MTTLSASAKSSSSQRENSAEGHAEREASNTEIRHEGAERRVTVEKVHWKHQKSSRTLEPISAQRGGWLVAGRVVIGCTRIECYSGGVSLGENILDLCYSRNTEAIFVSILNMYAGAGAQ